ncbi:hypothetical protein H5410_047205 [Solanum commersonii]|uniref:Uncharacterized protein n=1 Tax=Solanum commersonii TaxID=4109 RepID=A0A9J5XEH3_SOLCO|nr:hypothetical protein H5410_047205 [Solanum commersonii]
MEAQVFNKGKRKRDMVSCLDVFIKLETQRLDFVSLNQDLFRVDILQGIIDFLRVGETEASKIGKKTFLPITFIAPKA